MISLISQINWTNVCLSAEMKPRKTDLGTANVWALTIIAVNWSAVSQSHVHTVQKYNEFIINHINDHLHLPHYSLQLHFIISSFTVIDKKRPIMITSYQSSYWSRLVSISRRLQMKISRMNRKQILIFLWSARKHQQSSLTWTCICVLSPSGGCGE